MTKNEDFEKFDFNQNLQNCLSKKTFQLIATINSPYRGHFNCSVLNPHLPLTNKHYQGWFVHDGLRHDGNMIAVQDFKKVKINRPIILFYQKIN